MIKNTKHLQQYCLNKRYCLLMLHDDDQKTKELLTPLIEKYRMIRFTTLNSHKLELTPLEKNLPKVKVGIESYPRIILFKKKKKITRKHIQQNQ